MSRRLLLGLLSGLLLLAGGVAWWVWPEESARHERRYQELDRQEEERYRAGRGMR
jgi:hypothetical protein